MKVYLEISRCRECPYVINDFRLHDDPFTSAPAENTWYCTILSIPRLEIVNQDEIDKRCPFIDKSKRRIKC